MKRARAARGTEVDPCAAAVAAAHWLSAAAEVAARATDPDPAYVVAQADDIEALPHETPTVVLGLLSQGIRPREAVTALIRDALLVAEGLVHHAGALVQGVEDALTQSEQFGNEEGLAEALLAGIRVTPLDPTRPALDLLEDLLAGIRGCWLLAALPGVRRRRRDGVRGRRCRGRRRRTVEEGRRSGPFGVPGPGARRSRRALRPPGVVSLSNGCSGCGSALSCQPSVPRVI